MSYEIIKTVTEKEKIDFITLYNNQQLLKIEEGSDTYEDGELTLKGDFIFALEPNEIMSEVEAEIDVPDIEIIEQEIVNPETGETEIIEVEVPVMVDKEIQVPDYDEEGNIIGYHTEIIKVQSYHKETVTLYKPVINPNYEGIELERAKAEKIKVNDTARDAALNGGITYQDILFDSDTDQKVNLLAVVSKMGDEETITWYGMNNDSLECTKADLINIGGLITQLHSECWYRNACYKYAINAAETLEELEAIVIDYEGDFFRRVDDENTANIEL